MSGSASRPDSTQHRDEEVGQRGPQVDCDAAARGRPAAGASSRSAAGPGRGGGSSSAAGSSTGADGARRQAGAARPDRPGAASGSAWPGSPRRAAIARSCSAMPGLEGVDDGVDLVHPVAAHLRGEARRRRVRPDWPPGRRVGIRVSRHRRRATASGPRAPEQPGDAATTACRAGRGRPPRSRRAPPSAGDRRARASTRRRRGEKSSGPSRSPAGRVSRARPGSQSSSVQLTTEPPGATGVRVDGDLGPAAQEPAGLDQAQAASRLQGRHEHAVGGGQRAEPGPGDHLGRRGRGRRRARRRR